MYVIVEHRISNPAQFWSGAQATLPNLPAQLKLHQSFPTSDGTRAVCVWEAPSVAALREFLEPTTGAASRNEYYEVGNKEGVALPSAVAAS